MLTASERLVPVPVGMLKGAQERGWKSKVHEKRDPWQH